MSIALALHEPPRQARVTQAAFMIRLTAVLLTLVSVAIADFFADRDVSELKSLAQHGRRVNATVTDKRIVRGKSTSYRISFEYSAANVYINSTTGVNIGEYEQLKDGDPYPITYLPDDPSVFRTGLVDIDRANQRQSIWIFWIVVGTLALAAVWAVLECEIVLQRDLFAYGEEAQAVVTRNAPPIKGSRSTSHTIDYEIKTPHGRAWGSFKVPRNLAAGYPKGHIMPALYDPSDVHRSRIVERMQYATLGI